MAGPLTQFPAHPEKWLPKFNPDNGLLTEEHKIISICPLI